MLWTLRAIRSPSTGIAVTPMPSTACTYPHFLWILPAKSSAVPVCLQYCTRVMRSLSTACEGANGKLHQNHRARLGSIIVQRAEDLQSLVLKESFEEVKIWRPAHPS